MLLFNLPIFWPHNNKAAISGAMMSLVYNVHNLQLVLFVY